VRDNELNEAGILEIRMTEPLRILILEDNPTDAELIQFELQEAGVSFSLKRVMTEKEFIREIEESVPDIILSDYDLPRYNGTAALAEARRRCPDTPFILVTGAVSEDRAIEILTQGAKDYVLKNRMQQRLVPAVRRALAEAEEQKARRKVEAELHEAHKDLEKRVKIGTVELDAERKKMAKLMDALLNFSRLGEVTPSVMRLDMEGIFLDVWKELQRDIRTG
jgi:DNA-binding NtrC family response regulator